MSKSLLKSMINRPEEFMSFLGLKFSLFWKTTSHIFVLCLSGFTNRCVGNLSKQMCSVVYVILSKCKMQYICFDSISIVVMILKIYSVCWCYIQAGFSVIEGDQQPWWLHVLWPKPTSWRKSWRKTVGDQTFLFVTPTTWLMDKWILLQCKIYCHLFCLP